MTARTRHVVGAFAWLALAAGAPLALTAGPALAVTPAEVLADPALEARARKISAELRCLVCQNQSIDDSDAELAHDLRVVVRQRLVAGDTDAEVFAYVVSRYGEFVLLKPQLNWRNALLWATPVLLLLIGGGYILLGARRKAAGADQVALSDEERRALDEVLKQD
ncbi:MAG: cytochrome c-type biogenesis protein CcmH [Mesorhizobium sp.]|nr:cytochrome c-type biogenesis protein CcmH [Mesorhizobium sp.]